ncbi:hypothetical protein KKF84_06235 [Myxococcota bacterium]|nr:hypothetical protein [Myxococcota bacterium]MBU1534898.1 hypothetical protein [Myxococcota bacterium]
MNTILNQTLSPISTLSKLAEEGLKQLGSAYAASKREGAAGAPRQPETVNTQKSAEQVSVKDLNVTQRQDSTLEKTLNAVNKSITVATTLHELPATLLAPLSIAGGLWSLGQAQNVKGREAHFKAMAVDGAVDYLSLGNGKSLPALSGFPTMVEAAKGQKCLGQGIPLNSSFHNDRERGIFEKQYNKTMATIKKLYRTPEGREQLKALVVKYKAFKLANPDVSAHIFFIAGK